MMPPKPARSKKRAHADEQYEDDGFLVEDEGGPPLKKRSDAKTAGDSKTGRKERKDVQPGKRKDDEGATYWELSAQRRVTVSEFKGKAMVSIREYYEKDGKTLPGKKGISLTLEQYSALLSVLPDVEAVLGEKGEQVPRPNYDGAVQPVQENEPGVKEEGSDDDADGAARANHEPTSDEEE